MKKVQAVFLDCRRKDGDGDRLVILAAPYDQGVYVDVSGCTGYYRGWKSVEIEKGPFPSWAAAKTWLRRYLGTLKRNGYHVATRRFEWGDGTWEWK